MTTSSLARALLLACAVPCAAPCAAGAQSSASAVAGAVASEGSSRALHEARGAAVTLWDRAAERHRDALLLDGSDPARWDEYAQALYASGRYRESVAARQRAIQLDAGRMRQGSQQIARAYAAMGNRRQAERWLEQAEGTGLVSRMRGRDEAGPRALFACDRGVSLRRRPVRTTPLATPSGLSACAHAPAPSPASSCWRSPPIRATCAASPPTATAPPPTA